MNSRRGFTRVSKRGGACGIRRDNPQKYTIATNIFPVYFFGCEYSQHEPAAAVLRTSAAPFVDFGFSCLNQARIQQRAQRSLTGTLGAAGSPPPMEKPRTDATNGLLMNNIELAFKEGKYPLCSTNALTIKSVLPQTTSSASNAFNAD